MTEQLSGDQFERLLDAVRDFEATLTTRRAEWQRDHPPVPFGT